MQGLPQYAADNRHTNAYMTSCEFRCLFGPSPTLGAANLDYIHPDAHNIQGNSANE
jgi:hypothetical protein